jgi:hypothetical protein
VESFSFEATETFFAIDLVSPGERIITEDRAGLLCVITANLAPIFRAFGLNGWNLPQDGEV